MGDRIGFSLQKYIIKCEIRLERDVSRCKQNLRSLSLESSSLGFRGGEGDGRAGRKKVDAGGVEER